MKTVLISSLLVLSFSLAQAQDSEIIREALETQDRCGRLVQSDEQNLFIGVGSALKIISLDSKAEDTLALSSSPSGVRTYNGETFVLTGGEVQAWNLHSKAQTFSAETYALGRAKAYQEHAHGWAAYKNKMIIAHGRLGISFFDLDKKRLTNQFRLVREQAPLESMATGVTVQGRFAYVVMDNFSLVRPPAAHAFRGIIIIDMETEKVIAQVPGLDPGATHAMSEKGALIVSYGGSTYWKYPIDDRGMVPVDPVSIRVKFPYRGHPTGISSMDSKYVYSCYLKAPAYPGENGGQYSNVPLALDRKKMGL